MKAHSCGFCGESGHNRRTCHVKKMPLWNQWSWFLAKEWPVAVKTFLDPCEENDFPNKLFIRRLPRSTA